MQRLPTVTAMRRSRRHGASFGSCASSLSWTNFAAEPEAFCVALAAILLLSLLAVLWLLTPLTTTSTSDESGELALAPWKEELFETIRARCALGAPAARVPHLAQPAAGT